MFWDGVRQRRNESYQRIRQRRESFRQFYSLAGEADSNLEAYRTFFKV